MRLELFRKILFHFLFHNFGILVFITSKSDPAMVAEWSKTPVLQIHVESGCLGPRFESLLEQIIVKISEDYLILSYGAT